MSVQAMSWAFEQNVEPPAKLVLLALANRVNHETGVCYPGQELIGRECSMSSRTVRRHLRTLEERGLIVRRARMLSGGRGRTSDEYRIVWDQPDKLTARSGPTGQNRTTNRTDEDDQPDTVVRVTIREPKEKQKVRTSTRITESWQPSEDNLNGIRERHPRIDISDEVAKFRDHYISKDEKRADWDASFRTWMRNAEKWAKPDRTRHTPTGPFAAGSGGVYS